MRLLLSYAIGSAVVPFASGFVAQRKEVTVAAEHPYVTTAHSQHDFFYEHLPFHVACLRSLATF